MTNNNIYSNKKRVFYFDVLRAVAILCVILCHTTRMYSPYTFDTIKHAIPPLINVIGLVGVPLFFMLSGALLLNRDYDLKDFFKKRFTRILYPAIFWIIITILLIYPFFNTSEIVKIILGQDKYTWFVWVMIGIYLIIPVINSFIKEYGMKGVKYFLLVWAVTVVLNTANMYPFEQLELSYFAGYLGYVVLGYYLANTKFKLSSFSQIIIGILMFVVFTIANMYSRYYNLHIGNSYKCIFVVLASIGVFIFFKALYEYLESRNSGIHERIKNGRIGYLIFLISSCSYGMYFLNSLILKFVKTLNIQSLKLFPVIFILVAILSLAVVLIVSKISFLKKFSGAS